ncbi:MAG: exonuclease domain-containing protein [Lachnospiraceae bacterium]|nr:exonuclease domain-containing protein [Lachnospiraceae bacterium]
MINRNFVVLDLETTGLTPKKDRILEIGAVKIQDGRITETYETFVNPMIGIPPTITKLTGITDKMVENAPDNTTAVTGFLEFCGDLPLLGHNISFDYRFIKHSAVNLGLSFEKEALDTLHIARCALPDLESRSLEYLCSYYGISRENAHRAMDDVMETLELYIRLETEYAGSHPEWFRFVPLICKMKRENPATAAQRKYLEDLIRYHRITVNVPMESLTKNEASRLIDGIILNYGRIETRRK